MTGGRWSLSDAILGLIGLVGLVFLVSPLIVIVPNAFSEASFLRFPPQGFSLKWFEEFFNNPTWTRAAVTSVQVAIPASLLAAVLGTSAALGLDRWDHPAKQAALLLLVSPLIVPVVIVAVAAYVFFVNTGLLGGLLPLILAHSVLGLPFVILTVTSSLAQLDPRLSDAARSLGATPVRAFREVTLPLIMPGVAGGTVLAFMISFDDVVIATFLAGVQTTTLPLRMFQAVQSELEPTVAAASVLLIGVAVAIMLVNATITRAQARIRGSLEVEEVGT